eukprot:Seg1061.2 transcript_id=Seg1061.2/GoldUCD/mRNA.D3Y31 product="hypothetical protein" protein_id=Seg1061.2/GoldUCD/D3Y31
MHFLQEVFADSDGPVNPKRHRKGENIWKKGNQQPEIAPDLRCFPSDASFSSAWEKGLKECQDDLRKIGIKPDDELQSSSKNSWFFSPHLINATNETQIMEQMRVDHDNQEISTGNAVSSESRNQEEAIENEAALYVEQYSELALHLRQVADEIDVCPDDEIPAVKDVHLTVHVPDVGEIHKSTVFTMLNSSPEGLSKDRLRRVKSKHVNVSSASSVNLANEVGLFDDFAVCLNKQKTLKLGRIMRMRNKTRNVVEFKKPVSLNAKSTYPNLQLTINFYYQEGNEYTYDVFKTISDTVGFNSIVMKAKLTLREAGRFSLDPIDLLSLEDFRKNMLKKKNTQKESRRQVATAQSAISAEGRVVLVTRGAESDNSDDRRHSQRARRIVLHEAE